MKRFIIAATIIALIACGSSYLYIHRLGRQNPERALPSFREGDLLMTERLLGESEPMLYPLALYNSFLATAKGHFAESDYFLQTVLQQHPQNQDPDVLVQSFLTQAINAYNSDLDSEVTPLIDRAKRLTSESSVFMFFEGLSNYIHKHYSEAIRFWSAYSPDSTWMDALIERCFPLSWRKLHVAHCMTEEGDVLSSREILEKESHLLERDPHNYHHLATLFLGLSYLKEAQEVPLANRASYYKMARFYFERSGRDLRFGRERQRAAEHVGREAASLLTAPGMADNQDWAIAFIHTLEEWNATEQIESVAQHLTQNIFLRRDKEYEKLCQTIRKEFSGDYFHSLLMENMMAALKEGTRHKESDTMLYALSMLEALAENPRQLKREVTKLVMPELFEVIYADSESLLDTGHFLAFWQKLDQDKSEYERLGNQLLNYGQLFWKKEGFEEKGTRLLRLAADFVVDKQMCQNKIENFLCELYAQAEESNMIQRLSLIHDALDYFHVTIKEVADRAKIANHLADAEYLYEARNWAAAKTHASWVLKLDPHNVCAQRLVGLACFHMGEYEKALAHLQELPVMDKTVHKAIAFSRVYECQDKEEHLVQIDNIDSFDEDD